MERADILIRQARARSGNQEFGDGQGVPQRNFCGFLNDAQDRLFNLIMMTRPSLFCKEGFLSTTSGVASYALPTDVYLKHRLITAEYTPNGNAQLYFPLDQRTPRAQASIPGLPDSYFLRDGRIILSPTPMTGYTNALRLNYQYLIPRLDIRRALVQSVGVGTVTLTDNSLFLQESKDDLSDGWVDYISFVTADGVAVTSDLLFVSYNSSTRTITFTGSSTGLTGKYLVFGKNTSTHSSLPDICARYIVEYTTLRGQISDTSSEAQATNSVLKALEEEILHSIAMLEEDIFAIPLLDYSMLSYSDDNCEP